MTNGLTWGQTICRLRPIQHLAFLLELSSGLNPVGSTDRMVFISENSL